MSKFFRVAAFILAAIISVLAIGGCNNQIDTDSEYLTKGEFMNLFTSETCLYPSSDETQKISLDRNSSYYDAALALVEIGFFSDKEVSEKINDVVTKEFVAICCVKNLFFRKTFDNIVLKDESKLSDPQACKDAVGHEIVTIENGYFDAKQKMTYQECQAAIDRMNYIDATSKFGVDEAEIEINFKENVVDITDDIAEEDFVIIDPSDENFPDIIEGMTSVDPASAYAFQSMDGSGLSFEKLSSDTVVSLNHEAGQCFDYSDLSFSGMNLSANKSTARLGKENGNYCTLDEAEEDDLVVVRIPAASLTREVGIGEYIRFGLWRTDEYNQTKLVDYENAMVGEVVSINKTMDSFYIYYTLRIPSDEEVIDSAKLDRYNSERNKENEEDEENKCEWKADQLSRYFNGLKIGKIETTGNGFKIPISGKVSNPVDSWREATYEGDLEYEFEIKDISLQISGLGGVLKGQVDYAICSLNYTVVNNFKAGISTHLAPDSNRNGKFLNNLTRSRFTSSDKGADEVKIARLYVNLGYGFNIEIYLCLVVGVDGTIEITATTECGRGFKIINNVPEPIHTNSPTLTKTNVNVNIEAALRCEFSLRWLRGTPWADLDLTLGVGLNCLSKVFVLDESQSKCEKIYNGYSSASELDQMKESIHINYCFDVALYAFYEVKGLTEKSKIGKVIRWFDRDFKLTTGKQTTDIQKWHIEDGKEVPECTRNYEGAKEPEVSSTNEDNFILNEYKIIVPEDTCGMFYLISYPVPEKKLDKMGGIVITVEDEAVAKVHICDNKVVVEAVSVGSTIMKITTKNGRFTQACSITVANS